jgi:hypothetical protein
MFKKICIENPIIIIIILILLLVSIYNIIILFTEKKIHNQVHLHKIYNNSIKLKKKYNNLINTNYEINNTNGVTYIKNFLNPEFFERIKNIFNDKTYDSKNVILRKGNGVSFNNLHNEKDYNDLLSLYYSEELSIHINKIFNKYLQRLSLDDNNGCSLLIYTKKGDYIDWHYDFSEVYGDRLVFLLTIVNSNEMKNSLSHNEFVYNYNGENKIKMDENSLLIFKGTEILHKSTQIEHNERRILLSMVFCDVCQVKSNTFYKLYNSIKNNIL